MQYLGKHPTFEDLKDYNKCYGKQLLNNVLWDFEFTKFYEEEI